MRNQGLFIFMKERKCMDAIQLQNAHEYWLSDIEPEARDYWRTTQWLQAQEVSRMLREREETYGIVEERKN